MVENLTKLIEVNKSKGNKIDIGIAMVILAVIIASYPSVYLKKYNANILELPEKRLFYSINSIKKIVQIISKDRKTIFISNINYSNVIACMFLAKIKNVNNNKVILSKISVPNGNFSMP